MSVHAILLTNLAAAWFLTGLTWNLQVAGLPLLAKSGKAEWVAHRRRNTLLMSPVMLVEFATAAWLSFALPPQLSHRDMFHLFLLLLLIWMVTFLRYMPLHQRLIESGDSAIVRDLAKWNWIRTICWTIRAVALCFMAR